MKKSVVLAAVVSGVMCVALAACVPNVEEESLAVTGPSASYEVPDWFSGIGYEGIEAGMTGLDEAYAPKVTTLEDGRQVQLTPDSETSYLYDTAPTAYNTYYLNGDNRGCVSCHTEGLGDLLLNMSFPHWNIDNGLGTNIDVTDCLACHKEKMGGLVSGTNQFGNLIHGLHSKDTFNGNCMSCHTANGDDKGMQLWEQGKYDAFVGINQVEDVQGDFSYEQNVIAGDSFEWTWWCEADIPDTYMGLSDQTPDLAQYDEWTIAVTGLVDNPREWTLSELIDAAEKAGVIEEAVSTQQCEINPANGEWIGTAKTKGIPIMWILEQSGLKPEAKSVLSHGTNGFGPGRGNMFEDIEKDGGWLVYEINDKPLTYMEGFPCRVWFPGHTISAGIRWVNEIEAVDLDVNMFDGIGLGERGKNGVGVPWIIDEEDTNGATYYNVPVNAFMGTPEGLIIPVGKPYTFEGYSYGVFEQVAQVEFSMDGGETWTAFDTSDSDKNLWVRWNFTFTPEDPGAYVLQVRCTTDTGRVTYLPDRVMVNAK